MAASKSQIKASTEYNRRQDNIMLRPTKEHGAKIRAAAAAAEMPLQRYILAAVDEKMERESAEKDGQ